MFPPDAQPPTVACQIGYCARCPDPDDCTCACHIEEQEDARAEQRWISQHSYHVDGFADND